MARFLVAFITTIRRGTPTIEGGAAAGCCFAYSSIPLAFIRSFSLEKGKTCFLLSTSYSLERKRYITESMTHKGRTCFLLHFVSFIRYCFQCIRRRRRRRLLSSNKMRGFSPFSLLLVTDFRDTDKNGAE